MRSLVLVGLLMAATAHADEPSVCFAPSRECVKIVVGLIDGAKVSVRVQAYGFTDVDIARALGEARARGVDVQLVLDRSSRREARVLATRGLRVSLDGAHPIAHNKVIVVDGKTVITGSYNFTQRARRNAENILVLDSAALAEKYTSNWVAHAEHSEAVTPPTPSPTSPSDSLSSVPRGDRELDRPRTQ